MAEPNKEEENLVSSNDDDEESVIPGYPTQEEVRSHSFDFNY